MIYIHAIVNQNDEALCLIDTFLWVQTNQGLINSGIHKLEALGYGLIKLMLLFPKNRIEQAR